MYSGIKEKMVKHFILLLSIIFLFNHNIFANPNENMFKSVIQGDLEQTKHWVEKGASVHSKLEGSTPLHIAAFYGKIEVLKFLIEKGALINAKDISRDNKDWTPLHYAAYNGKLDCVKYLIEKNADINAKASDGATALHFAVAKGYKSIIIELLKSKADTEIETIEGLKAGQVTSNKDIINLLKKKF